MHLSVEKIYASQCLFTSAKICKQSKCPSIDEWIRRMWYTHTHTMDYYSTIKKNENLPFATTWIDLEESMLSQAEKDKYYIISHMESKK